MTDIELQKKILIAATNGDLNGPIDGYTNDAIKYNRKLLIDMQFLDGKTLSDNTKSTDVPWNVVIRDITPSGCGHLVEVGN